MIFNTRNNQTKPYKLGLALSGGGARGFAHAGALKALEEADIHPDLISGVSAGSIVGVLYADGYTPDEILELFAGVDFNDLAQLMLPRSAFFKMDGFRQFLKKHLRAQRLEDLAIPTHIIATNLDNGESVTFTSGAIIERVCASCSIPVVFPPVKIDGTYYVDGGVLRNFPVTPIRHLCDNVIGINVNPVSSDTYKQNIVDIAKRSYEYIFNSNSLADKELCDILIETDEIVEFNIFDIDNLKTIATYGYEDTKLTLAIPRCPNNHKKHL